MKRSKGSFLIIALSLVWLSFAVGQTGELKGKIKGKVLRKDDNKPLYNATVRIRDSQKSTRSDKDGEYTFDQLDAGQDYVVEVSKSPLYEDGQTTVNVKADSTNPAPDVSLQKLPSNTAALQQLVKDFTTLLQRGDLDLLETRIKGLKLQCKGEDDEFCKGVTAIDKAVEQKKMGVAERNMDRLRDTVGIRPIS